MSADPIATTSYIAAGDDRTRYDDLAIRLHWVTDALVVIQFALAETWGFFSKTTHHLMVVAHTSLGTILVVVIAMRLIWRLTPGHKVRPADQGLVQKLSKSVHWALYGLLVLQAVLGLALGLGDDHPMSFFGLPVPTPFSPLPKEVHHQIGDFHNYVGWTIVVLACGHAMAALYHHYHLRDGLLRRMLPQT